MDVSVIIPTYNSAKFVADAIDSALAQTQQAREIIVIDDGSTDNTSEVLHRYRNVVRVIRQENAGVSNARNRGLAEGFGEYAAFLDADDVWEPNKLAEQIAALSVNPTCRAVFSAQIEVKSDLSPIAVRQSRIPRPTRCDLLCWGNVIGTPSSVLVDRNLVMSVGGFDPQLSQCADWDLWIRLLATTDFAYVETPLVRYRVHESNMSRNVNLLETDSERVLTKVFSTQNLPKETCRRRRSSFARNAMVLAGSYYHAKCYRDAARCLGRSLALDFRQASYLAAYPKRILYRWFGLCKS